MIERLRQEVVADPWTDLLHETAADALGIQWRDRLFLQLDGASVEVLALLRWIVATRSSASFANVGDRRRLDGVLLRRALFDSIKRLDVARAAVLHHSLRRAVRDHLSLDAVDVPPTFPGGEALSRRDFPADAKILQQIPAGASVQIQFIQGGQHVGDKINIGGDNIGSAVGRNATVVAREITAYKKMLDASTQIEPELQQKLFEAREEVERTDLSAADKQDVAESLKRLAAELNKPDHDVSVIRRFWSRVKEVAPTVAAILSSAATIAKLTGHG